MKRYLIECDLDRENIMTGLEIREHGVQPIEDYISAETKQEAVEFGIGAIADAIWDCGNEVQFISYKHCEVHSLCNGEKQCFFNVRAKEVLPS